jgi:hypothetical protein
MGNPSGNQEKSLGQPKEPNIGYWILSPFLSPWRAWRALREMALPFISIGAIREIRS